MRGSIKKRQGKRGTSWRIVVNVGYDPSTGKRIQKVETVRGRKEEAEKRLTEILGAIDNGIFADPGKITVAEYLRYWFNIHKTSLAQSTARRYQGIIDYHLIPSLGRLPLKKLTKFHIQNFIESELKMGRKDNKKTVGKGLSDTSVLYEYRVLYKALQQAIDWDYLPRNPAKKVKLPKRDKPDSSYASEEQVNVLLNHLHGSYLYIPVFVAVYTGMRLGEILGLTWTSVDLSRGVIQVKQTSCQVKAHDPQFKAPKTAKSKRNIDISDLVIQVLKEHKKTQAKWRLMAGPAWEEHNLVCCQNNGKPINPPTLSSRFRTIARKLSIPISFHGLRHTHATFLLKAGIPAKVVSERLGHSKIGITMDVYSHVMPGMQQAAANKLETLLNSDYKKHDAK